MTNQVDQLAIAMLGAFSPEITTREGRGERQSMIKLSLRASKFGTLLVLIFLVPLIVEMEYVFKLWLINPPEYAVQFCRFILFAYLFDRFSTGFMLAINAHGKIAAYQSTVGITLLLTLPLAWLFLYLGGKPHTVGIAFVVTMALVSIGRVIWAKLLLQVSFRNWLTVVFLPCVLVAVMSTAASLLPLLFLPASFFRLLITTGLSLIIFTFSTWSFALDSQERIFIREVIKKMRSKICIKNTL